MNWQNIRRNKYLHSFLLAMLAGVVFKITTSSKYTDDSEYLEQFWKNYQVYAIPFPEDLYFAGEKVPMHDFEVRERVDREMLVNTYFQSASILHFKKAARWFPAIEKILKEHGVPDDFKYIAVIESGLSNVVSPAGAVGFWQIMKNTGTELGLQVDEEIDERYDPIKSTHAACRYFKKAYKEFGNWTMVAASYNMGMGGLKRQSNQQGQADYHALFLNTETSRYVPRLLAVKQIMENPKQFGYHFKTKHLYKPLKTNRVEVDKEIADLAVFAKEQGISYKHLKVFNPWIRKTYLPAPAAGKKHLIDIPDKSVFDENLGLKPEYKVVQPEVEQIELKATQPDFIEVKHSVEKGQTLRDVAKLFEVRVVDLVIWNELETTDLVKGQELKIHVKKPKAGTAVQSE